MEAHDWLSFPAPKGESKACRAPPHHTIFPMFPSHPRGKQPVDPTQLPGKALSLATGQMIRKSMLLLFGHAQTATSEWIKHNTSFLKDNLLFNR